MDNHEWSSLPDHILVSILSYLSLADRYIASIVCRSWNNCFASPYVWTDFKFWFYMPTQSKYLKCVELYGCNLKSVYIELDQSVQLNRENACLVLSKLSNQKERRLQRLKIKFTGENPLFYAGQEFISALKDLFGPAKEDTKLINQLIDVDLSGLPVAFDDVLFNLLSENHSSLQKLNILNRSLVCKVKPACILRLVGRCRKLKELCLYNCSLSEDVLLALTEDERSPLEHLSIFCRREEKYREKVPSEIWQAVTRKLPNLRVTFAIDHTCPLANVSELLDPHIPVHVLMLETFTRIYDEVNIATSYYAKTLEKMVLQTTNSPELNRALVNLAEQCTNLRSLHVFCVIEKDTVERILNLKPEMKERESYTLKYVMEPHPWIAGKDY